MSCEKYHGRMRDICEGKTHHSPEERAAYIALWEKKPGLGDAVAWVIRKLTFGRLKPTPDCGCGERKERLNRWWERLSNRIGNTFAAVVRSCRSER